MLAIPQRPSADIRIAATPAPRRPQRQALTVEDLAQRVGIPLRKVRIKGASALVEVSQQLARSRVEVW